MTNDEYMHGAEECQNESIRPPKEYLVDDENGCDYCDFYDERLAFSSADGPILLLAIPRRY